MSTWWRVFAGIAAGAANSFANGTNWKQVLLSVGLAAIGVVSHASSTSDTTTQSGIKPSHTRRIG